MLLQDPALERRHDLSSLRLCVSAGETLPEIVYKEWYRRTGVEILDGLGATEMFHVFISARAGSVRPGATGIPVPGYEAKIVDDQFREVPRGIPGLLTVRGPTGCRYWRKPEMQRNYVRQGWNVTGDVYIQDKDGYFWYQCRNDDMILCGGYNIAGPEVESVLLEHPAVVQAAVVASPDPVRGFVPGVRRSDAKAEAGDDLVPPESRQERTSPYKYPREIEFVRACLSPRQENPGISCVSANATEKLRPTARRNAPKVRAAVLKSLRSAQTVINVFLWLRPFVPSDPM
jgi:2-aminobenzoate-CoA ligase